MLARFVRSHINPSVSTAFHALETFDGHFLEAFRQVSICDRVPGNLFVVDPFEIVVLEIFTWSKTTFDWFVRHDLHPVGVIGTRHLTSQDGEFAPCNEFFHQGSTVGFQHAFTLSAQALNVPNLGFLGQSDTGVTGKVLDK